MANSLRIGYFINQYPAVSHSFIRREILALEGLGWKVSRFAIRPGSFVDSADQSEAQLTKFIINISAIEMVAILARQLLCNCAPFFRTLVFALRFNANYQKNLKKILICFVEACVLHDWAKKQGIQHIHAHFGTNSATITMLSKKLGVTSYSFTMHGSEEFDRPETIGFRAKVREATFVAAISSYTRSQLFRWIDFADWEKVHVIHCGLDTDFLNCSPLPIPKEPRLVSVGRLIEQKGQILVIKAISQLVSEGLKVKLILVGEGPMRRVIEQYIIDHALSEYVELTGSLNSEQVREQLSRARVFLLPSFMEGLPVVIMEAFALGRPVISTYVAGIPELVVNDVNGWLLPAGSVEELVVALRSALQAEPEVMAEMGKKGRERVLERHSITKESAKLSKLFARLAV